MSPNSALKKGISLSFIFALIIIGGLYYATSTYLIRANEQIAIVFPKTFDISSPNIEAKDSLNETIEVLGIASIEISEGTVALYAITSQDPIQEIGQIIFPMAANRFIASGKTITYSQNIKPIIITLSILTLGSIILLFTAVFITATAALKQNKLTLKNFKNAILTKKYEDIPFADLSEKLKNTEETFNTQLSSAQKKIEQLELTSSLDPLTGLYNRISFKNDFEATFKKLATSKTNILGIIRASEIITVNGERGYQMGDKYIKCVANIVKNSLTKYPGSHAYRISGADFAIIVNNASENDISVIGDTIKNQAEVMQKNEELNTLCYCGFTPYKLNETPQKVMARADLALAKAQTGPANGLVVESKDVDGYLQGELHWRQTVVDIINRRAITLFYQPIKSLNISITPYVEIFSRFTTKNGEFISTENVLAAAHRHDLIVRLEEMIIEAIIQKYYQINNRNIRFGINLSANALISASFLLWLERTLVRNSEIAPNLVFEIDETLLESNPIGAERLFSVIVRAGSSTSISHFGNGIESFRIYRELKPNYIKLDPNLCQNFDKDLASSQFVRMIVEVSHRLGCVVIAEGVENTIQKQHLENLYIDAIQGYLIVKPKELIDEIELSQTRTIRRDFEDNNTYVG